MWTSRLAKNLEECRQAKHGRFKTPGCKGLKMVVTLCVLCYNKVSRAVSRKIMVHSTRVHSLPPKKPTAGYTVLRILWNATVFFYIPEGFFLMIPPNGFFLGFSKEGLKLPFKRKTSNALITQDEKMLMSCPFNSVVILMWDSSI